MLCNASVRSADLSLIIAIDDTRRELSIEPTFPAAGILGRLELAESRRSAFGDFHAETDITAADPPRAAIAPEF
jgi:hypothetical protein